MQPHPLGRTASNARVSSSFRRACVQSLYRSQPFATLQAFVRCSNKQWRALLMQARLCEGCARAFVRGVRLPTDTDAARSTESYACLCKYTSLGQRCVHAYAHTHLSQEPMHCTTLAVAWLFHDTKGVNVVCCQQLCTACCPSLKHDTIS